MTNSVNDKDEVSSLVFFESASGEVRRSIPMEPKHRRPLYPSFSPDGKYVACNVRDDAGGSWLNCRDVASGHEMFSLQGEQKGLFRKPVFSSDGRRLAVTQWVKKHQLYLIDVMKGKCINIVPLAEEGWLRQPVFSPDGKWIAVLSQYNPTKQSIYRVNIDMLPQPRILLIEAATGEVRETLVAPPGFAISLCFSPDGKTLASGGDGRVLLWDMTNPPGTRN